MKKIVIELSDETYNDVIEEHYLNVSNTNIYNAIRNGTPLQKKFNFEWWKGKPKKTNTKEYNHEYYIRVTKQKRKHIKEIDNE